MSTFFNNNSINLFTDASVSIKDGVTTSAPGCLIWSGTGTFIPITPISIRKLSPSTNNEGEICAFYMAVKAAIIIDRFSARKLVFNLFSDSLISVMGVTQWYKKWVENSKKLDSPKLLNSSGKEVANQQYFLHILHMIFQSNIYLNIYHVKGHVDSTKEKEVEKFIKDFIMVNNISDTLLTKEEAIQIINFNNKIDNYTRDVVNAENFESEKQRFLLEHNILTLEKAFK